MATSIPHLIAGFEGEEPIPYDYAVSEASTALFRLYGEHRKRSESITPALAVEIAGQVLAEMNPALRQELSRVRPGIHGAMGRMLLA